MGRGQCWILPRFKVGNHSSVLPHLGKLMGVENRIEDLRQEGNRSLGKMLECPVRDTFLARNFPDVKTPNGSMNLVRVA